MLENCKSARERWGGVSEIIDRWLQSRQSLLVRFCGLSEKKDFTEGDREVEDSVRHLCQLLVDYVSAGHFEVYEQLIREGQAFGDKQGLEQARQLYKEIDQTTDIAVDFNDKYQETDDLSSLVEDLSQLGEALELRFSSEDQMIALLHTAHKNQLA
ncbi:Rsd/AlgQ family anti-sigma factor [Microbulbifer thermotolerans]|uniref:Rsd/AlgQ family anti-sigma factor n=1 Tax=Microbulbifer thermotolerans TaxID=252514 RepID=A0A143HQ38_MICTH|nr:Rsd/AlgQ family anti-sigma factor [Microbulbifer thermotolerans]AMX03844.1 transcriptional regulator [Microbulbifer thermotolerans]MCX2778657.1 Rsd/AlgQ family anti-sigma factor [Microbulbifer thermotolerans]MCX2783793.1 Rsd/AlgQ family anti-sigma factor [Microbulbifer thermotolerans]MCX2794127.1 Rsd/AlgQ family anti-sigma factor [Microbulbifer thermotolerans]MCX2801618.1 Rsd/AlgQ family anti-sigma factor [Microbulbifer thermotolerans]